jgi:hypothetical protein
MHFGKIPIDDRAVAIKVLAIVVMLIIGGWLADFAISGLLNARSA